MDVKPDQQNINSLFGTETFYIDFYQRQYKWNEVPVKRLLDDIFYKFNQEYKKFKDSDVELEKITEQYSWYYLNTYVTNKIDGKTFVVDGQQRLTTLTLLLIKLAHLGESFNSELKDWVIDKIIGRKGYKKEFWMNHEDHTSTMKKLLDNVDLSEIDVSNGITSENLVKNFAILGKYLESEISDVRKYESFVFYVMNRLVLIKLNVEQTDVPMIFEVINDRGVKLKPYEILKGKLLGQINKYELDNLKINELWEDKIDKINSFYEDEIDTFFTHFLKAKYSKTRAEANKFDNDYHRTIFSDQVKNELDLDHQPNNVKHFLLNEFSYYTNLYIKILNHIEENDTMPEVAYNELLDRSLQYMLILSACKLDDENENEKIQTISYELDRMYALLLLQQSYDSNLITTNLYKLNADIRNKDITSYRGIFDKYILEMLSISRGSNVQNILSYSYFKDAGISLDIRFKRYFFARIEKFISQNTNLDMKRGMYDLIRNTGSKNGFHIEHILSENEENYMLFNGDDELFQRERNRLGGLLLLKGRDNQSSNNEPYSKKLKSYSNTLYWNETLREDTYKSKLDFNDMINNHKLNFRPLNSFGQAELEERHQLLFEMVKIIWK